MIEKFQLIAHRGASKYAPENTMAAFNSAIYLGSNCIECDIAFSKDNVPVIFHDDALERTTNGKGSVCKKNLEQLRQLDAGSWFAENFQDEKILTLKELLIWHNHHAITLNLEIKKINSSKLDDYLNIILKEIEIYSTNRDIIFSSFQEKVISKLNQLNDSRPRAYLVSKWNEKHVEAAKSQGCIQLNVGVRGLKDYCVQFTHAHGLKLGVYTVNDIKKAIYLKDMGVDAIFTDDLKIFEDRCK